MAKLLTAVGMVTTSDRRPLRSKGMSADQGTKSGSAADIARNWQLEGGIGFLLRLLEARYDVLYQNLTRQNEITPRQFGVLIALYQHGPLTPSVLAEHQLRPQYAERDAQADGGAKTDFKKEQRGRPQVDPGSDRGQGRGGTFGCHSRHCRVAKRHAGAVTQGRSGAFPQMPAGDCQGSAVGFACASGRLMPSVIGATGINSAPHFPERARLGQAGDRLGRQAEVP
jgi:hypothetical protein